MIHLYNKEGNKIKADLHKYSYSGTFMGECFVTATIESEQPIDFEIGDYFHFRSEKFVLNYLPAKQKQARQGTHGSAFVYDNIKFNSLSDELTRVEFIDVVLTDNQIHFTSLPDFSFYAKSVKDLAGRIQANLDRIYTGAEKWTVIVSPEAVTPDKHIQVNSINCWEAVQLANKEFGANYIIRNRTITIGTAGISVGQVFGYGKGNGLYDLQQVTNQDARIVTRLRAYGSTRNIPHRYYNKLTGNNGKPYIADSLYIPNLMLPEFPYMQSDPKKVYLDSPNRSRYGIREGSVYFDGKDDDTPEIFPSLEGMTKKQLNDAGINVSLPLDDNGNIDECLGAENPIDNGEIPQEGQGEIPANFTIYLKDLGFDLSERDSNGQYKYATTDTMQISMKSGYCIGRTFDVIENGIVKESYNGYTRFKVVCKRFTDESIAGGTAFPNKQYPLKAGDKYVILGIDMPDIYVKAASQRLLDAAKEYLPQHDDTKYTYSPKIDEIFMAKNPSIGERLKEGDILDFTDTDLQIDASVIIQTLKINVGEKLIPTYEVTLSNDRIITTLEKMQNAITQLTTNNTGVTIEQVKSLIINLGTHCFLSRLNDDDAEGNIRLLKDLLVEGNITGENTITAKREMIANQFGNDNFTSGQFGSGFRMWKHVTNGQSYAEVDNLLVRREAIFNVLTIAEIKSVGGQILVSPANLICSEVENVNDNLQGSILKSMFSNTTYEKLSESEIIATYHTATSTPYIYFPVMELPIGGTYTFSFEFELIEFISGFQELRFGLRSSGNPDERVAMEVGIPQKIVRTITIGEDYKFPRFIIFVVGSAVVRIKNVKFEEGIMATSFVEGNGGYKCFFDTDKGTIPNQFALNDQCICRKWNGQNMRYYWRRVTEVGNDYILLSKTDSDGTSVPSAGDDIIQFGNRTDVNRQSAIMISAYGSDAPSIKQYAGINSYDLTGKEVTVLSPYGNKFTGTFTVKSGNQEIRVPADKGIWKQAESYYYYDRVTHNGALWLCIVPDGQTTTEIPSDKASHWQKQVAEGEKGDKGDDGLQGVPGEKGADGITYYTWIRYADTINGGGISNSPTGKTYIGLAYNKTTATESDNPADYKWSLIKGDKGDTGVEGEKGADGQTYYTWIKYSDHADGTGLYDLPQESTRYIGIAVNKTTPHESINKLDYVWSLFKGADGKDGKDGRDGINGTNGIDGSSAYFHVRYSANANGNPMQTIPAKYIGTAVAQSNVAPSTYTAYTWYDWKGVQGDKGENGIPGQNGADGKTSYLHIKYSDDGGKTFTANNGEDIGDWLGQYVDFIQMDSMDITKYHWSRIKGDAGTLNYIEWKNEWTVGSATLPNWTNNGAATKNERIIGENPFGINSILWKCKPDATGSQSGGFNTVNKTFDPNYSYRYTVFVWKNKSAGSSSYHGCYGVANIADNTANGNPYFWHSGNMKAGEWLLMVGYIHPNAVTQQKKMSGVYDMTGRKIFHGTDYKFTSDNAPLRFRSYLYYCTDPTVYQLFYNPMVHRLDGTEPSIDEILQVGTAQLVDTSFEILDDRIQSKVSKEDFSSLEGRVSTTESKIEQHADQINMTVEKVEGKGSVYKSYTNSPTDRPAVPYAKNDLWITYEGRIKQSKNTQLTGSFIDSDWMETTVYTDDSALNNLQIGGRNLMPDSGTLPLFSINQTSPQDIARNGKYFDNLIDGERYMVSFDAKKISGNGVLHVEFWGSKGGNVIIDSETTFKRYGVKSTFTTYSKCLYMWLLNETGEIQVKNVKIELGDKPTDWSPAPEDMKDWVEEAKEKAFEGILYCRGSGNNRPANRILTLNNQTIYNTTGRGLRLTVFDRQSLTKKHDKCYDLYSTTVDYITELADYLNGLSDDVLVVLTSYDYLRTNEALAKALARCGGSGKMFDARQPYALVGIPTIGKGNGLEVYHGAGATEPYAEISTRIVNGTPQGLNSVLGDALGQAANAQATADGAKLTAENATGRLNDWASDNYISPNEKTALIQQFYEIKSDYTEIYNNAKIYGLNGNADFEQFATVYELADEAIRKYTSKFPENIPISSDYNNIAAYYTTRHTILDLIAEEAKKHAENVTGEMAELVRAMTFGKMLYKDPTFISGDNSVKFYNNSGNGTVTVMRITKIEGCPTTSTHCMQIKTTGAASPDFGGFTFKTMSRANAKFVTRIIAKIPKGMKINFQTQQIGNGFSTKWITSQISNGDWQEYIFLVNCGINGTFGETNFYYLSGTFSPSASNPLLWYLAYATVIDITDSEMDYEAAIYKAEQMADDAQTEANKANTLLGNIANDNIVTPVEKIELAREWEYIKSEYPRILNQGTSFSVVTSGYTTAYNNLTSYVEAILANMNENSAITGSIFRTRFKNYYDNRLLVLNNITNKIKSLADTKNRTYYQTAQPEPPVDGHKVGDMWFKPVSGGWYEQYRWNGGSWVLVNQSISKTQFQVTADSVSSLVSKTGINSLGSGETLWSKINQTATDIRMEVASRKIGGRNLLPNTNMGTAGWSQTIQNGSYKWENVKALGVDAAKFTTTVVSTGYHVLLHDLNKDLLKNNTYYTISFDMLCTFATTVAVLIMNTNGTNNVCSFPNYILSSANINKWVRVVLTNQTNSTAISGQLIYMTGFNKTGSVTIANLQLEEGNVATDWTPAPEDTGNIAGSYFNMTSNKITLGSKTIELKGSTIADAIKAQDLSVASTDGTTQFQVGNNGRFYNKSQSGTSQLIIDSQNRKIEFKNSENIYTSTNGIKTVTQTTSINATNGRFESSDTDSNTAYLSSQGIFANRAGVSPYSATTGVNLKASIAGLGFGAMNKSYFNNWGLVGVFGRADNSSSNPAPSYGGWFDILKANGLCMACKQISSNTTLTRGDNFITCYNSAVITVYLPKDPYVGHIIYIRRMNSSSITINGNGINIHTDGNTYASVNHKSSRGDTVMLIYDGQYWTFNYLAR